MLNESNAHFKISIKYYNITIENDQTEYTPMIVVN